jgi:hypothetical protein
MFRFDPNFPILFTAQKRFTYCAVQPPNSEKTKGVDGLATLEAISGSACPSTRGGEPLGRNLLRSDSKTKCRSGCLNALLRLGFAIRKNSSILGFSSNPTKKVSFK